jgi:hypothetical protein
MVKVKSVVSWCTRARSCRRHCSRTLGQVRSSRVKSGQVKSSQVKSGQVRSGQVTWCTSSEAMPSASYREMKASWHRSTCTIHNAHAAVGSMHACSGEGVHVVSRGAARRRSGWPRGRASAASGKGVCADLQRTQCHVVSGHTALHGVGGSAMRSVGTRHCIAWEGVPCGQWEVGTAWRGREGTCVMQSAQHGARTTPPDWIRVR